MLRKWLRKLWLWLCPPIVVPMPPATYTSNPAIERFDWLKHYGPLWEPGSLAFWLEPDTNDQLAGWYITYRPGELGIKEHGTLRVEIVPPRPKPQQMTAGSNLYLQQASMMQQGLRSMQSQLNRLSRAFWD